LDKKREKSPVNNFRRYTREKKARISNRIFKIFNGTGRKKSEFQIPKNKLHPWDKDVSFRNS